jgi:hypothetical protein
VLFANKRKKRKFLWYVKTVTDLKKIILVIFLKEFSKKTFDLKIIRNKSRLPIRIEM